MKTQQYTPPSLRRASRLLIVLALLLLSAAPGAFPAAAQPTALGDSPAQPPAGLSAADWRSIQLQTGGEAYLKASNAAETDNFGASVAVSGDTVVVGAPGKDGQSGAAYVFTRGEDGVWSQQAYLKAANPGAYDSFGASVAISGDTLVVGAVGESSSATGVNGDPTDNSADSAGAAYVFTRSGEAWSQQAYLKAFNTNSGDRFGYSVAISGDTVVVGAIWEDSGAAGVDGDQSDNSVENAGAAYVFTRSGDAWSQQAYLKASNPDKYDTFGISVAISDDTLVVGANGEDSSASGVNGNQSDNSTSGAGAAYVFARSGGTWSQQAYLKASNPRWVDEFGVSVAVSGDTAVVGAVNESSGATGVDGDQDDDSAVYAGAAYVFTRSGDEWSQQAYLKASNTGVRDYFGRSVAISGDTLVVGAYGEASSATGVNGEQADNSASDAGAAYVFTRTEGEWSQLAYLKASNTAEDDWFGYSAAVSDGTVVVGALFEDSAATEVNGDQSDNSAPSAGAAYIFTIETVFLNYLPVIVHSIP